MSAEDTPQQMMTPYLDGRWTGIEQAKDNVTQWDTGVELDLLRFVGKKSVDVPENLVRSEIYEYFVNIFSNTAYIISR